MASGIEIDDNVPLEFQNLKQKKCYRYIIIRISKDLKRMEIEAKGALDSPYQEFLDKLKEAEDNGENRFAVYDFPYDKQGITKTKILFINWNPDNSKIKQKMVYASSQEALSKKLDSAKFISHSDFSELNEEDVTKNVMSQDKV